MVAAAAAAVAVALAQVDQCFQSIGFQDAGHQTSIMDESGLSTLNDLCWQYYLT